MVVNIFEQIIAAGINQVFGVPELMGAVMILIFYAFVTLQNTRLDFKIAIMIAISFLAMIFFSWLSIVIALVVGGLVYLAIMKFENK